jgi:hypothetical protein
VYTLPQSPNECSSGAEQNAQIMFAAERRMSEYMRASPCRTANASEANLFFVPLLSTCAMHRGSASTGAARRKRNPHIAQQRAVHDTLRYIKREYRSLWEVRLRTINLAKLTNQRVGFQKLAICLSLVKNTEALRH